MSTVNRSDADGPMGESIADQRITRRAALALGGALAASAASAPLLSAVSVTGQAEAAALSGHLVIWTFFDQVKLMATQFQKKNPGVTVDVKVFPGNDYETKIRLALQTGQSTPDIFDLERGYIGKFLDTPFVEDLSALGAEALVKDYIPYAAALGRDHNGIIRAVTDNCSPGGFWYRRDVAATYLGSGDPAKVSAMVSSWDKIIALGTKVAQASKGQVHLLASYNDALMVNQYSTQPWVNGLKLTIDPAWNGVLDTARQIRAHGVDAKIDAAFSPAWGAAWNNGSVVMFAWPSWIGFMIDKKKLAGKWAIATAPKGYYSGGTYRAIYAKSKNKALAYEFVKFIASPEWQNYNLKQTLNMPALRSVFTSNAETFHDPLLGNQPVLKTYYAIAEKIPPHRPDKYSEAILALFGGIVGEMIRTNQPNQWAFDQLKKRVRNAYPELTVS